MQDNRAIDGIDFRQAAGKNVLQHGRRVLPVRREGSFDHRPDVSWVDGVAGSSFTFRRTRCKALVLATSQPDLQRLIQ